MENLRVLSFEVADSTSIIVRFTKNLTSSLVTSNVSIISEDNTIENPKVLSIKILNNTLKIVCQPLTQFFSYDVFFKSTTSHPFISVNSEAKIFEDGIMNKVSIVGPIDPSNPIKDFYKSYLDKNIYDVSDSSTFVGKAVDSLSTTLAKALYDIRQIKNDNYLSFKVVDEQKVRGSGPFDRLNEEGAYEVLRVGTGTSSSSATQSYSNDYFPSFAITLQSVSSIESLTVDSTDQVGTMNINTLVLNLAKSPVTRLKSLTFTFITPNPVYVYNIETFGYQIKDSRYDKDFSSTYFQLSDNQIKINEKVLENPSFDLLNIFSISVEYEYKDLGKIINSSTVVATNVLNSTREVLPPIVNIFNLKYAPVVDSGGNTQTINGVTFTDPNSSGAHPAFVREIPFRLNGLPALIGDYSIDYETGTVYVYGSNSTNDGTGPFPPLATYKYLLTYKVDQDYVYDEELYDFVALPFGSLINNVGKITFKYEKVLIPGVDYLANVHKETLTERIENRLVAANALRTINPAITSVFRIYNETSGEQYTVNRWNDNKVYFSYTTPPRLLTTTNERVKFHLAANEFISVNTEVLNASLLRVFKIFLNNNTITNSSDDGIGTSFNSSVSFSDQVLFSKEIYFDRNNTEVSNINRLIVIGDYSIDYSNGIVYVAVSNTQSNSIGLVTYKTSNINPDFPHLISVDDIYYQISSLTDKDKKFNYVSFEDDLILPENLDYSDEKFLNNSDTSPYQVYNKSVGVFINLSFLGGVTNKIKFIRGLYENSDLLNNSTPINFSNYASFDNFNITVNKIEKSFYDSVKFDGLNYYVLIDESINYISPNITYTYSVVRTSDSLDLWDLSGVVVPGNPLKLVLSGVNSPALNDFVKVTYSFEINNLARVIVDYNKGDLFVDYTYLADEIIISYEYGDNVIDFRQNTNLPKNSLYYVTYKVGALRDSLLKNFGTLINIPELLNFDVDFDRERYRDSLYAALSSFIQGPTISGVKNIAKTISHVEPEINESIFEGWSLGNSLLCPRQIQTAGSFSLLPGKFGDGVLINSDSQTIKFPLNSSIRLEEGTFETWITPQWDGIDNDSIVNFEITESGVAIDPRKVFIGTLETHPTSGSFSIDKSIGVGKPNTNKDGVYVYYDKDISGNFNRWYVEVIDGYVDAGSSFKIKITSKGVFYDTKSTITPKPANMSITSGVNYVIVTITNSTFIDEAITFVCDNEHYIVDFGDDKTNRLSIYKDVTGYINFRVFDNVGNRWVVSSDISAWRKNTIHHVAASWKISSRDNRDEIHLFIDGFEVPNIVGFEKSITPYLHEKFRTITADEVIGLATKDIVGSTDLVTTFGSNVVSSQINFSALNLFIGDVVTIDEVGFSTYTITNISGQNLTLSSTMPLSLTNAKFSINKTSFQSRIDIDIYPNIYVSTINVFKTSTDAASTSGNNYFTTALSLTGVLPGFSVKINGFAGVHTILQVSGINVTINATLPTLSGATFFIYSNTETELPGKRTTFPNYTVANGFVTFLNGVYKNDLILIHTLGLNHKEFENKYYVWGDTSNIIKTRMPSPIDLEDVLIKKIILPNRSISVAEIATNITTDQPSNINRFLTLTISGTNVDFTSPTLVTVDGINSLGPVSEVVSFSNYGSVNSVNNFSTVNFINVATTPINALRAPLAIEVRETDALTTVVDGYQPVIRYSYIIGLGFSTLYKDAAFSVKDDSRLFSYSYVGNYIFINNSVFYKIVGISLDRHSLILQTDPISFTNGSYQILNTTSYRSGLQNGYFIFEIIDEPGVAFPLTQGFYEFEYFTYSIMKFDPLNKNVFFGMDINNNNNVDAILDELKIYSTMLTDTRIQESIPSNQRSITKDFNSLKPLKKDANTLMLCHFDTFPFVDESDYYLNNEKNHFQSNIVVNENFGNSIVLLDKPIIIENDGIFDSKKEGTIEFWVNPLFDSANDPNVRFYFDAFGAINEEVVSTDNASIKINTPIERVISVTIKNNQIDYFAGGRLEIDTQNAIQENGTAIGVSSVITSYPILQVISVYLVGDLTKTDYFSNGAVAADNKTIYFGKTLPQSNLPVIITYQSTENNNKKFNTQVIRLNKRLPNHKTKVVVNYIPKGLQGDRVAIYKDEFGYITFGISASGKDYVARAPTRWYKNTWHRVKASYKLNSGVGTDEMRLFVDGYEYSTVTFGEDLILGPFPLIFGSSNIGDGYNLIGNIVFKDKINTIFIGSDYKKTSPIFSLIDNFRLSNLSRPIYAPYGESIDVNYNSNSAAFPVTPDLYTTYLLDFNHLVTKNTDFSVIRNKKTGRFDFSIDIFDSFGIVNSSVRVKEILEKLIKVLKPASSRVFFNYL